MRLLFPTSGIIPHMVDKSHIWDSTISTYGRLHPHIVTNHLHIWYIIPTYGGYSGAFWDSKLNKYLGNKSKQSYELFVNLNTEIYNFYTLLTICFRSSSVV